MARVFCIPPRAIALLECGMPMGSVIFLEMLHVSSQSCTGEAFAHFESYDVELNSLGPLPSNNLFGIWILCAGTLQWDQMAQ